MGRRTDLIGHITITPPLNPSAVSYLTGFSESRRWARPGGPYVVPDNPRLDDVVVGPPDPATGLPRMTGPASADLEAFNRVVPGQPSLYCSWRPCPTGCCLTHDGVDSTHAPAAWLRYLVAHFLADGAYASSSGLPAFADFTAAHVLDGVVAGCCRDTRRLFLIRVRDNVVREQTLVPGSAEPWEWGPFPYESQIDELDERRRRRRPATGGLVSVGPVVRAPGTTPPGLT